MKDLCIEFKIDDVKFVVTSISNKLITSTYPKHCHSKNSYEIHYIPSGYGSVIVDDISYEIGPNTLYTTGPGVFHEQIPNQDEPMSEYGINFDVFFKSEKVKKSSAVHTFLSNTFWFGQDNQNLIIIFKQIFEELSNRFTGYTYNLEALCKMLLILIIRNYEDSSRSFSILPEFSLNTARNLIIENAFLYDYSSITLDLLSKRIGLSKRQTERLLKEQYGKLFYKNELKRECPPLLYCWKPKNQSVKLLKFSATHHANISAIHLSNFTEVRLKITLKV